jgi:hypothetical protein
MNIKNVLNAMTICRTKSVQAGQLHVKINPGVSTSPWSQVETTVHKGLEAVMMAGMMIWLTAIVKCVMRNVRFRLPKETMSSK